MTGGRKQIEARMSHLSAPEEVSDMWSDSENSDTSHYHQDEIRIKMDNQIVSSLHGALNHDQNEDEPVKFRHNRIERGNLS